jgi:hypothetical protein
VIVTTWSLEWPIMPEFLSNHPKGWIPLEGIRRAHRIFHQHCKSTLPVRSRFRVARDGQVWEFDNADEFFLEYGRGPCSSELLSEFEFEAFHAVSTVAGSIVALRLASRAPIATIAEHLKATSLLPSHLIDSQQKIFIGHGRDPQWRLLADHLRFSHGCRVITYENSSTVGESVHSVLDRMLAEASFAVLVHTAEFRDERGFLHASPNVIHETGLFQSRLGRSRALILRERGCQSFANIGGITQLNCAKGNIREAFGDVVAAISGPQEPQ